MHYLLPFTSDIRVRQQLGHVCACKPKDSLTLQRVFHGHRFYTTSSLGTFPHEGKEKLGSFFMWG